MKILVHGDDNRASRELLNTNLSAWKNEGKQLQYLDGHKLALRDLATALASANLYAEEALVIENFLGRPLSAEKKKMALALKEYAGTKHIAIWEKKEVTKAQLNSLGSDFKVSVAKTPAIIFQLLDSLAPGSAKLTLRLLHQTLAKADDGFVFIMLTRHLAELIVARSGDTAKLLPWKKNQLIAQAKAFPESTLLEFHTALLSLDRALKTGQTKLSYGAHLDLLFINLLK